MVKEYSRRRFIKIAVASGAAISIVDLGFNQASGKLPIDRIRKSPGGPLPGRYVMVLDLDKCMGCGKCTDACISTRFVPR